MKTEPKAMENSDFCRSTIREALNIGIAINETHPCISQIRWLIKNNEVASMAYFKFEQSLLNEYAKRNEH
jgi:hypothetical protein